ncbi:MFS general substrate transporter [Mycena olivaceomarginata]|nr:MFS general substrate transporter [Mycena olivaceomarginata]
MASSLWTPSAFVSRLLLLSTYGEDTIRRNSGSGEGFPTISYTSGLDVAIDLAAGHADRPPVSAEDSRRMRAKLDWHLLPLLFCMYTVQFIDKSTLSYTAVLGIIKDANLTIDDFNTLGSAFYIGYLVFQYPQNLALQYFPVGKWMTINLFLWALLLGLHCVCHSFSSFCRRFATDIPCLMLIASMFYTRVEIGERIGWTFQCNGFATIIGGFLAFGAAHVAPTSKPNQWQVLYLTTCLITLVVCVWFAFAMPDNPTTARFLSEEEKILVVRRVQENQNGIEMKKWKKDQFVECLKDYKTWMWFFWCAIANLQNGLGTESARVIKLFGSTTLQTTFLNIPSGVANGRAWIHNIFFIPNILAALIQIFLPYSNKIGHLTAIYILNMGGGTSFVMMLSWVASATAGHTKKLATNGIFLIGYALGQTLCTQFWKAQYEPKFIVPWTICLASYAADIAIVTGLWFLLRAENARREALSAEKGLPLWVKVEKGFLDLTDRQNLAFRYVL